MDLWRILSYSSLLRIMMQEFEKLQRMIPNQLVPYLF
jgi:hypothetical protein